MQLTKDDFIIDSKFGRRGLDFSKFLEVRTFYEKYMKESWRFGTDEPDLYNQWMHSNENDLMIWLFDFCFVEGLK